METIRLSVQGMSCPHCAAAVRESLLSVEGVKSVQVSLEEGLAQVQAEQSSPQALLEAVRRRGYEAQVLS